MSHHPSRACSYAALFLLIGIPVLADAQERPTGLGVGLTAGYAQPSNSLYSGSVSGGILVSIGLMRFLGVEIQGGYFGFSVEGSADGLSKGKLTVIPIQMSLQGRFPVGGGRLTPFLEAGGGFYLNSFAVNAGLAESWERIGFALEEKVEGALGFHFGAGLDYFLGPNLSLGLGLKYGLAKMKGSWSLTDIAGGTEMSGDLGSLDLNPLTVGLRLRYVFK